MEISKMYLNSKSKEFKDANDVWMIQFVLHCQSPEHNFVATNVRIKRTDGNGHSKAK